ncbi:MAG: chitobiase/beta-hexosaminidase C-terminal domain-containing protein [Halanaerobiales bacterium]|nr:chitobiase/beta-hexosaminidase C-terminal domain-containing protein [Halanaerobiales bacterium]
MGQATMTDVDTSKINLGPCKITHGGEELGRTEGDTVFRFTTEYQTEATEEDGDIMDIVINHNGEVEMPNIYTDPASLAKNIPWANLTTGANGGDLLEVGSAIGTVMNDYAEPLVIHPLAKNDADKSADIVIPSAYPMPDTLEMTHSRTGKRVNNMRFKAQKDTNGNYFTIGDNDIVSKPVASVESGTYSAAQTVELTSATSSATIYYTTDGTEPTTSSTEYTEAITVDSPQEIRAFATAADMVDSEVVTYYYTGSLT